MPTIRTAAGKGAELTPTEADTDMKRPAIAQASNYNLTAAHNRDVHELGGTVSTVTLPTPSNSLTETDDWRVTLVNTLNTSVTVARADIGHTVDGATSDITLRAQERLTIYMASDFSGFFTDRRISPTYFAVTAYRTADVSIVNNTYTDLEFTSDAFDSGSLHDTSSNQELFVAPAWATKMRMTGAIRFASNPTGSRGYAIRTAADVVLTPNHSVLNAAAPTTETSVDISTGILPITGGESYKIQVFQNSGSALNVASALNQTYVTVEFFA